MRQLISFLPLLALMAVSACETVKGAGRDLETAGQAMAQPYGNQPLDSPAMTAPQPYQPTPYPM